MTPKETAWWSTKSKAPSVLRGERAVWCCLVGSTEGTRPCGPHREKELSVLSEMNNALLLPSETLGPLRLNGFALAFLQRMCGVSGFGQQCRCVVGGVVALLIEGRYGTCHDIRQLMHQSCKDHRSALSIDANDVDEAGPRMGDGFFVLFEGGANCQFRYRDRKTQESAAVRDWQQSEARVLQNCSLTISSWAPFSAVAGHQLVWLG